MRIFLLLLATAIWGFGFIATRWTLGASGPFWATEFRFLLAAALVVFIFPWRSFKQWKIAWVAGGLLFLGLLLQTWGLVHTTVAKSAFLTTTYAIFVPAIVAGYLKRRITLPEWSLIFMAMVGVALMCDLRWDGLNFGDWLTIACAISFAIHILWIDHYADQIENAFVFNLAQTLAIAVLGLPVAFAVEGIPSFDAFTLQAIGGFAFLAFISTLIAFGLQVEAQKGVPPHVVSTIFLLESPFGALFGWLLLSESLTLLGISGATMITLSALGMAWRSRPNNPRDASEVKHLPYEHSH